MPYAREEDRRSQARKRYRDQHKEIKRRGPKPHIDSAAESTQIVRARLSRPLVGRLQRLVNESIAEGVTPWQSMSRMIEELVLEGMRSYKNDHEAIAEMLPYLEAMRTVTALADERRLMQGVVSRTVSEVNELLAIDAADTAARQFHKAIESLHGCDEGAWQRWAIKELETAFPMLVLAKVKWSVDLELAPEYEEWVVEARKRAKAAQQTQSRGTGPVPLTPRRRAE